MFPHRTTADRAALNTQATRAAPAKKKLELCTPDLKKEKLSELLFLGDVDIS